MIARVGVFRGHRRPGFKWYVDSVSLARRTARDAPGA